MPSPNIHLAVPFFSVSNMENSLQFYINKLGFIITKKWEPRGKIEWCWLQRDNVSIMLQQPRSNNIDEQYKANGNGIPFAFNARMRLRFTMNVLQKVLTLKNLL